MSLVSVLIPVTMLLVGCGLWALALAAGKSPAFDATAVLTEIARAASSCGDAIATFGDDEPFPIDVLKAVADAQQEIAHATHALVLMLTALRKRG